MRAWLELGAAGVYASVQDQGRPGFRRIGVPPSGVLDPALMRIANTLAGNPADHPVVECYDGGQCFNAVGGPVRIAVAGSARLEVVSAEQRRPLAPWRSVTLAEGERLRVVSIGPGRLAMIAIHGLKLVPVLGSCSTYSRSALGGMAGRALSAGDQLPVATDVPDGRELELPEPWAIAGGPIRVVPGPQFDHFGDPGLATLLAGEYKVGTASDRMGIRLEGPAIAHLCGMDSEIVSDAIVPGAIQVPGNGQAIALLADAQTAGGYPKIATIISADLGRMAGKRPGDRIRFTVVSAAEGVAAARDAAQRLAKALQSIRPRAADNEREVDIEALYHSNLVSGVVDAVGSGGTLPDMTE